jgi:hypothetical protein
MIERHGFTLLAASCPSRGSGCCMRSAKLSVLESLGTAPVGFGNACLLTQLARDVGKKGERNCSRSGRDAVSLYLPTP